MNPEKLPIVHHTASARPRRVFVGPSDPIKLELADPNQVTGPIDLDLIRTRSQAQADVWLQAGPDGVAIGFDGSRSGAELSFSVADETHHFTRDMLRKFYSSTPTKKESSMSRIDTIQSRLRDLEAELADIKRFGEDAHDDGAVITFKGDFGTETTYSYAAIKAGGRWHLTGGKAIQNATWAQLVDFMLGAKVRKVRLVTGTERIV